MAPRHLPPLNWLRAFEAAARHMSFTLAADELGITQSAVSQQIKLLEAQLKLDLFIRRPRSLMLSDAGRDYLPFVQRAFDTLEEGSQPYFSPEANQTLTVYVNSAFSALWLMPRLMRFTTRHPAIRLDVLASFWNADLAGTEADIEIRYGAGPYDGEDAYELHRDKLYPVCSPSIADRIQSADDLRNLPRLWVRHVGDSWDTWAKSVGIEPFDHRGDHQFNSYILNYGFAVQGGGVALGHDTLCAGYLEAGQLVRPLELSAYTRERYYLVVGSRAGDPAIRFKDWILEEFSTFAV